MVAENKKETGSGSTPLGDHVVAVRVSKERRGRLFVRSR
jgi:hypothetical protein